MRQSQRSEHGDRDDQGPVVEVKLIDGLPDAIGNGCVGKCLGHFDGKPIADEIPHKRQSGAFVAPQRDEIQVTGCVCILKRENSQF